MLGVLRRAGQYEVVTVDNSRPPMANDDILPVVRLLAGHLGTGVAAVLGAAVGGAVVAGVVAGSPHAKGYVLGCAIVLFFFSMSSLTITWADIVNRKNVLSVGIATYLLKLTLVGLLVFTMADRDWPGFVGALWGIVVATSAWMIAQIIWAFRTARAHVNEVSLAGTDKRDSGNPTGQ